MVKKTGLPLAPKGMGGLKKMQMERLTAKNVTFQQPDTENMEPNIDPIQSSLEDRKKKEQQT